MGNVLMPFVSISVALILFEGGLSLNVRELRDIGGVVRNLVTIDALVTWVMASFAAWLVLVVLRLHWTPEMLDNAFSPAMVVGVFTVSNHYQAESGLLATTVMGIALANQRFTSVKHIVEFKENLRVLIISTLFILLAARLEASVLTLKFDYKSGRVKRRFHRRFWSIRRVWGRRCGVECSS